MEELRSNFIHDIIDEDLAENPELKIHTRFPPEPNGYLHIGSAKAIWINAMTAKKYGGQFNLRYDDTNPSKEDNEYVESIYEDLTWLGCEPTGGIFYGSDYFDMCYEYAVQLIKDGKAYVCDLNADEIGVEVLFATTDKKGRLHIQERYDFSAVECIDGRAKYVASINPDSSGLYQVAGRIYAKNSKLPHRQDFELVRWL